MEGLGLVDGEDENDVFVVLEGVGEDGAVAGICDP